MSDHIDGVNQESLKALDDLIDNVEPPEYIGCTDKQWALLTKLRKERENNIPYSKATVEYSGKLSNQILSELKFKECHTDTLKYDPNHKLPVIKYKEIRDGN